MKKQLLFIAIASLVTSVASATDLYVRNLGAGGAYSTVSAAIAAASDGDRIIIKPKTSGSGAYVENITINKSLTFVSETIYNRYFIQGTINITPQAGRIVTINGLSSGNFTIYNVVVNGATTGGRTTVNLLNCYLNNVNASQPNATLNISGCIVSGGIGFSHGKCTGNRAQGIGAQSPSTDTSPATDDIEIIGNSTSFGINISQDSYNFKCYNNFIKWVNIYKIKTGGSNEFTNNTIYDPNGGDVAPIYISLQPGNTGNIAIMNNAVSFTVFNTNFCIQNNNIATVTATYNVFTNTFLTEGTITQSNNTGAANMSFDNTIFTVTGMNANAGNPALIYTDLDLTRNDAGHYGGSNSWENYWPADGGGMPKVNYLVTPRAILNTNILNVTGSGYSN